MTFSTSFPVAGSGILKPVLGHDGQDEKARTMSNTESTEEPLRTNRFNAVPRGHAISSSDDVGANITGYGASMMRARATLSSDEEKKLLRRIDWRLIPLLSIMYMVKTIDASNVC